MELAIILSAILVYLLPSIIAGSREHQNGTPLLIVNLAAGWTLIGWIGCLAWSFSNSKKA